MSWHLFTRPGPHNQSVGLRNPEGEVPAQVRGRGWSPWIAHIAGPIRVLTTVPGPEGPRRGLAQVLGRLNLGKLMDACSPGESDGQAPEARSLDGRDWGGSWIRVGAGTGGCHLPGIGTRPGAEAALVGQSLRPGASLKKTRVC